jgi:hypothetical protein
VIGSAVQCSSGTWLGGDCAVCASTGELKPLRAPATAVAVESAGIQPVRPSGERDSFVGYGVLLGSRFSGKDGRGAVVDACCAR